MIIKRPIQIILLIVSVILFYRCSDTNKTQNETNAQKSAKITQDEKQRGPQKMIIVYGSMHCDHCLAFRRKLDSRGLEYTFNDVDNSDELFKEMQVKIQSINYTGYVNFPIVDIGGKILVNPKFNEAEKFFYMQK